MTIRTQIRNAAIAALNLDLPTGIPACTQRRFIPGEKLREPRLAAFFEQELVERKGGRAGPLVQRNLILSIQAMLATEMPEDADDLVEPMLEHIIAVMGDTNLNGLTTDIAEVNSQWFATDNNLGRFFIVVTTRWRLEYQTRRADLGAKQ